MIRVHPSRVAQGSHKDQGSQKEMIPNQGIVLKSGYGAIAQLGERLHGMQEVGGSIPPGSTSLRSLRELGLGKPRSVLS